MKHITSAKSKRGINENIIY